MLCKSPGKISFKKMQMELSVVLQVKSKVWNPGLE